MARPRSSSGKNLLSPDVFSKRKKVVQLQSESNVGNRCLRWKAKGSKEPLEEVVLCTNTATTQGIVFSKNRDKASFWYDERPDWILPLLDDFATQLQKLLAAKSTTRNKANGHAKCVGVLISFLLCEKHGPWSKHIEINGIVKKPHIEFPDKVKDITREILLDFRTYLLTEYDKKKLKDRNGTNWNIWQPTLALFNWLFIQPSKDNYLHSSIIKNGVPVWSKLLAAQQSTTEPYDDLSTFQFLTAAEHDCKVFRDNWELMREIEAIELGSTKKLENFCWFLVNVIWETLDPEEADKKDAAHWSLRRRRKLPFSSPIRFYNRYSRAEIIRLAESGCYPSDAKYYPWSLLTLKGKITQAKLAIRRKFDAVIQARQKVYSPSPDDLAKELSFIAMNVSTSYKFGIRDRNTDTDIPFLALWETAGFKCYMGTGYPFQHKQGDSTDNRLVSGLFVPNMDVLYPFFIHTHLTAGTNQEVVASMLRETAPDIDAENICYFGYKAKVGNAPVRKEEIVVPRKEFEPSGIDDNVSFVLSITEPLLHHVPTEIQSSLWACWLTGSSKFFSHISTKSLIKALNKRWCTRHQFVNIEIVNISKPPDQNTNLPVVTSLDARRVRETSMFARYQDRATFAEMQRAANDDCLDTVIRHYLNSKVQRQQNYIAIASLQNVLMSEIAAYEPEGHFQGKLVPKHSVDEDLGSEAYLINNCANKLNSNAPGQEPGRPCTANFRHCLGCRQSRVFREHLPAIQFSIIQYEERKERGNLGDWEERYGLHHRRAKDCLSKWSQLSEDGQQDVIEALMIARTEGGVYLPPLD
ncbi:hypothetical protein RGG47_000290 [Vibrio parahaemolyticus]|nr:hypothetical protein [Vibrio parahaemolyticus]